jgi:hypothetical protein
MVGTWALLVLVARRLPPGLLRALALRYAARQVPGETLAAAWPGEPRLLERPLGSPDLATG